MRAGLRFDWQVGDVLFERRLPPEQLHHLMRIVQEAIANIIKHAHARTITVKTRLDDRHFVLEIRDDGAGLGPARAGGRGLRNMQQRAHQLGAVLTVTTASPGAVVALRLPLGPMPDDAASVVEPN
jgi:signal transduction histidine kinase